MTLSITVILIGITVLVSYLGFNDKDLKYKLIFSPYSVKHHKRWWLIFTHGFIHADSMHLLMNMVTLYFLGPAVEYGLRFHLGSTKGLVMYVILYFGALAFATIPAFRKHSENPGYLSLGASGAVSAVVFALIIIAPFSELAIYGILPLPAIVLGILYLAFETYSNKKGRTNIAHDAHIAGAIFGMLFLVVADFGFFTRFIHEIVEKLTG